MHSLLIVEDNVELAALLVHKARLENFHPFWAKSGAEGLAMALRLKPALIISDIVMPNADGLSMLKELRKHPWGSKVPVIVMSNYNSLRHIARAIELGVYEFVVKTKTSPEEVIAKARLAIALNLKS